MGGFIIFYDNLNIACKRNNTTITAVLKQFNISTSNGTSWKKGVAPSSDVVIRLSEFLNVSTDFLLTGKEKSSSSEDKELSSTEKEMLLLFSQLSLVEQAKEIGRLSLLIEQHNAENMKYKAKEDVS